MKKTFISYLVLLLIFACKKKEVNFNDLPNIEKDSYEAILNFLENEALESSNKTTTSYIQGLKSKIDKKSIQIEKYYNSKVIVVSLTNENSFYEKAPHGTISRTESYSYTNTFNLLVFHLNQDTIINAEILECHTNQSEQIFQDDIASLINFNPNKYKGEVRYRKLNQKFLYTLLYEDDKKGYLTVKKGSELNLQNHTVTETNCIDWYIVTTYTYPDGSQTVTEQYIGTTCGDPEGCNPDPYLEQLTSAACGGPGGSGGGTPGNEDPSAIPHKKLCGSYNWKITGAPNGASNTNIKNLYATYSPNNNPSVRITVTFSDACVTIPNHCSTNQATLSTMLNDAFNNAVLVVEAGLSSNTIPGADWAIKDALDAAFKAALKVECPGSHFANQGCTPDIPWQLPTFCD